jgi:hypothetical protein
LFLVVEEKQNLRWSCRQPRLQCYNAAWIVDASRFDIRIIDTTNLSINYVNTKSKLYTYSIALNNNHIFACSGTEVYVYEANTLFKIRTINLGEEMILRPHGTGFFAWTPFDFRLYQVRIQIKTKCFCKL